MKVYAQFTSSTREAAGGRLWVDLLSNIVAIRHFPAHFWNEDDEYDDIVIPNHAKPTIFFAYAYSQSTRYYIFDRWLELL